MTVPKLRFPEFKEEWKEKEFGEVFHERREKTKIENEKPLISCAIDGLYLNSELFSHFRGKSNLGYIKIKMNDLILSAQNLHLGNVNVNTKYKEGMISPAYKVYEIGNNNPFFVNAWAKMDRTKQFYLSASTEGASQCRKNIEWQTLEHQIIPFPSLEEQQKNGSFFAEIDNSIALNEEKLSELQNLKKSLIQKMFPKAEETVPEIRFPGFETEWELCKFSDYAITRRGLTYKPENKKKNGKRVLRSSNINEDAFELHCDDVFVEENVINIPYVKNGDILITAANGSNNLVGKHTIVKNILKNTTVHGGFMLLASTEEPEFLNASMSSSWYSNFINTYITGGNGAIGNLSKGLLDEQFFLIPSREEQRKIGSFFKELDNRIELQKQLIDEIKEYKKGLLQQMFC